MIGSWKRREPEGLIFSLLNDLKNSSGRVNWINSCIQFSVRYCEKKKKVQLRHNLSAEINTLFKNKEPSFHGTRTVFLPPQPFPAHQYASLVLLHSPHLSCPLSFLLSYCKALTFVLAKDPASFSLLYHSDLTAFFLGALLSTLY